MTIIIEIDRQFTVGIDWFKTIKGVRLGFIAVHFVFARLGEFVEIYREEINE